MLTERYNKNKFYLNKSKFRSGFKLDEKDLNYITQKGVEEIKKHAIDFVTKRLAPAKPHKDGKQTPYSGHPVFKAQHAVGMCCRHCLEKWYEIPRFTELNNEQINSIAEVLLIWISEHSSAEEMKHNQFISVQA